MAKLYARQTPLNDVAGRLDYISNPNKQENLLAACDTAADLLNGEYWNVLAKESQEAFEKYGQKTRMMFDKATGTMELKELQATQARELVIKLSNALLRRMTPEQIAQASAEELGKILGRPVSVALHYNKSKKNLHIHVIYSERELLKEPVIKKASRALFYDENGKRRYKKSEILDADGQLRPGCRIVAKGEVYETHCFGAVDHRYADVKWLEAMKAEQLVQLLNGRLKGDQEIVKYDAATGELPQQHIGNKILKANPEKAEQIRIYNEGVKNFNQMLRDGKIPLELALEVQEALSHEKNKGSMLQLFLASVEQNQELIQTQEELLSEDGRKPELDNIIIFSDRKRAREAAAYWKRYREIRDQAWTVFIKAQRAEIEEIRSAAGKNAALYLANSYLVDPETGERRMYNREILEQNGYFEQKAINDEVIRKHKAQLKNVRGYQNVARARQDIIRKLMIAGADSAVIEGAMASYEQAMRDLQHYAANPEENDFEGRRLKVARWSLQQAQQRADRYLKELEAQKLQPEESALMKIADLEYQSLTKEGKVVYYDMDKALEKERQDQALDEPEEPKR